MTYDPAIDAPKNQEQLGICVDYWLSKEDEKAEANPAYIPATREELVRKYAIFLQEEQDEPVPTLAELKREKLFELKVAFDMACDTATVTVDGLTINANETANRNISGLITLLENDGTDREVEFCLADNSFATVNLQMLKTFQIVLIVKGQQLYTHKWELRSLIEAAQNEAELNAITVNF